MSEASRHAARRGFLGRLAAGAAALVAVPRLAGAEAPPTEPWLGAVATAKHKQVFDAPEVNGGFPMIFVGGYLGTMSATYKLAPEQLHAVLVVRHFAAVMALKDAMWAKYNVGAALNIMDPATKAPATRNFLVGSRPGDMMMPEFAIDRLVAGKQTTIAVCNIALTKLSGMMAEKAGMKPEAALAEWTGHLVAGAHVAPSGVLAVGRAQEAGCTYCFAG